LDIELSEPLGELIGLDGYAALLGLVRLQGEPLGYVRVPVHGGHVPSDTLQQALRAQLDDALLRQRLFALLAAPGDAEAPDATSEPWPSLSIAVCTRNHAAELACCLDALCALDYPGELELLVVDNAPSDDATERLVRARYPQVRYVRESRPGLDWARNRAILDSRGAIIAYTDDDVAVDRLWARALGRVFAANPGPMAVTGLVVPLELETTAQQSFERYGGFGRGFTQRWFGANRAAGERAAAEHTATGKFGTGANMAYSRELLERIGGFDPALDVGTVTNGGGDLELFFRVIRAGFPLVYEPRAIVRHRHRRDEQSLLTQIANNGVGFYAYLVRCFQHFPDERLPIARQGLWWFLYWYLYRLLLSFVRPVNATPTLIMAELRGGLAGLGRYQRARRSAATMAQPGDMPSAIVAPAQTGPGLRPHAAAVRVLDLNVPLAPLNDVTAYPATHLLVQRDGAQLGVVALANLYRPVSVARLRETLVDQLGAALLPGADAAPASLTPALSVSVVVATCDRPNALRACLRSIVAARPGRPLELLVVDNNPTSGLTRPVVASFPGVRYLSEPRPGLVHARNCGIRAATGAIVITLDETAVVPSGWPARLLAPFVDSAVMAVIGTWLPAELESPAQQLAENFARTERLHSGGVLDGAWLTSAPAERSAWQLGGASNAAFRARLFADPSVALFDEALGGGQRLRAAEALLFHKLLRAGHKLALAPQAFTWFHHGPSVADYLHAVESAAASRAAFELTLALRARDRWALRRLLLIGPCRFTAKLAGGVSSFLRGRTATPASALLAELRGAASAPLALIHGHIQASQNGPLLSMPRQLAGQGAAAPDTNVSRTDWSD